MRKATLIQTGIWRDAAFRSLSTESRLTYLMLISQPDIEPTGMLRVWFSRWQQATGLSEPALVICLRELEAQRFLWLDMEAGELVVRGFVKWNIEGRPNLETAAAIGYDGIVSEWLRYELAQAYPGLFEYDGGEPFANPSGTVPEPFTENGETVREPSEASPVDGSRQLVVSSSSVLRTRENARGRREDVEEVFKAYQEHHPGRKLTKGREKLIERRLREFSAPVLVQAIHGNHLDPWCCGENPNRTEYHDLETILRNADKIERYADLARTGPKLNGAARTMAMAQELRRQEEADAPF